MKRILTVLALILLPVSISGNEPTGGGEVRVPLEVYQDLVNRAQAATTKPRPAPARYALGKAKVSLTVSEDCMPTGVSDTNSTVSMAYVFR